MRVLVLGEGPTDLGRFDRDGSLTLAGSIPVLVERLIHQSAPSLALEFKAIAWRDHRLRPQRGSGFDRRLVIAADQFRQSISAIIGVADRDGAKNRSRAEQLLIGRQSLIGRGIACATGLNVEMLESTLLADEVALRLVLNVTDVECQPDPESLTSRDEKSDRHPKGRLSRLIQSAFGSSRNVDFEACYADIARCARLEILEARCPSGFAKFASQVRDIGKWLGAIAPK